MQTPNNNKTGNLRPKKVKIKIRYGGQQQLTPGGSHTQTHKSPLSWKRMEQRPAEIRSSTLNEFNGNFIRVNRYTGGTDPRENVQLRSLFIKSVHVGCPPFWLPHRIKLLAKYFFLMYRATHLTLTPILSYSSAYLSYLNLSRGHYVRTLNLI